MAELHIPGESLNLILTIGEGVYEHDDSARADARAIAAPVVAAELRRLADRATVHDPRAYAQIPELVKALRARADDIEGEAR